MDIIPPKIGFSMTEGVLAGWLAEDDASATEGQTRYEIESDKSINEVESPATGTLTTIIGSIQ